MKFMRWVMEVRPLRLLVDCIAAYATQDVSRALTEGKETPTSIAYRFSSSILIRKPWSPLALVLFTKRLVVPCSRRR